MDLCFICNVAFPELKYHGDNVLFSKKKACLKKVEKGFKGIHTIWN